ncbi:hypothetical protein CO661_11825 [Sinorhizobium fredii]|uniref:Uncharacterized protein n=1 Tax=Rhizobium fredii TaxID=380 RepID=A0A2A6LYK9_RHIFR|nr:hypothetical protein [Sinorhizobium fredii]PDT47427.1 hypothetical protein CO661_11825 [Sinorhizobium fredii]
MTKRAPIKQADLNRLAAVAKRNNITIEVEAEGYTIRMHPNSAAPPATVDREPEEFTSLAEWQAWRDRQRAREARGKAPAPQRDSAWDIPWEDIPPEPIQPPLNWRERKAMDYLMAHGPEIRVDWYALKDYGSHTQKKLEERGFVEASSETDRYGHPDQIWLTKAGAKAMRDQRAHRDKYPCL